MKAVIFDANPFRWVACWALGRFGPGVFLSRLSGLGLREIPIPKLPGPDWVRLKTRLGGICGTDLGVILHKGHPANILRSFTSFPLILGHENVAAIDEVGANVTGWKMGQRVCVEPSLSCAVRGVDPICPQCERGLFSLCASFREGSLPRGTMLGLNNFTSGSWAPYFIAHQSQLQAVPDDIADEEAVLVDPLACSLHGVLRHTPGEDDRVLVQGAGIIGLGVVAALRALGVSCHITALVRNPLQEERMRAFGADGVIISPRTDKRADRFDRIAEESGGQRIKALFGNQMLVGGYDVVYDCVGTGETLSDAMKFTRPRGTMVAMGTTQICLVDTSPLWFSELNLVGVYGRQIETVPGESPRHTYGLVMDLMRKGHLKTEGLLTHTFATRDYKKALDTLIGSSRGQAIKVAFHHPE